jgi:Flp pilus assembly protein TadG
MMRTFQQLRRNEQGVAIIELALAAPILACLLMGAADVGNAYSRKLALEQGAQRAVEKVMQTTELANVQDTIAGEVAIQADVDPSQVTVTFPRYCDDRKMPDVARDPETGLAEGEPCAATETEGHYILVVVADEYTPFFRFLRLGTKLPNGNYRIQAEAGMRTK